MRGRLVALLVFLVGCPPKDTDPVDSDTLPPGDIDGDGFTVEDGDCDDARASIYPGAEETPYDGLDSDCSGGSDNDVDGDGADSSAFGGTDCDDDDAAINPTATEVCDDADVDEDCDGNADDADDSATGTTRGGIDDDGDGYAGLSGQADLCDHPANGGDCDDANLAVHPGAVEVCNGVDDDCDFAVDSPSPTGAGTWYVDEDGDGAGSTVAVVACLQPANTSVNDDDCDDTDAAAFPGAPAVACDGVDNDCDDTTLETGGGAAIGSTPYATVRAAVLAATDGQIVNVCEGRHVVNDVVITNGIELVGPGRASTVLDADHVGTVLRVLADAPVVIRGLTLTGGGGFDEGPVTNGGAMWIDLDADVTLEDSLVTGSTADSGAGLYIGEDATVRLVRTLVTGNSGASATVAHGGGVFMDDGSTLELEESEIFSNTSGVGAGVAMEADTTILGDGASGVNANESDLAGAGIDANRGGASISGIEVIGNQTDNAAAGISGTDLTLTDVLVQGNDAGLSGGGFMGSGDLVFTRVIFDGNHAGIDNGAIDVFFSHSSLTLDECEVTNNIATFFAASAGGVGISDGSIASTNTDWGASLTDNPPGDLAFGDDEFVCNYIGLQTFTYDDGSGVTICP